MTFAEWNDAIVRRFFNELNAGKRVFLAVDGDVLTGIGGTGGTAEFVSAVKKEGGARVCRTATAVRERWRAKGGAGLPPYVAYLGVLVLAASTEGEYPGEGFQKRLH